MERDHSGAVKRPADRYETYLSDAEWSVTGPLIPPPSKMGRPRVPGMREVFNGIRFMLATGCQRRAVPKCFPPFTSIQNCFHAWSRTGVLERMLNALWSLARELSGRSEEPAAAVTGSRPVKTTESGGPAGCDARKRIKGRKRHITVDAEGSPITIAVHVASAQDRDGAVEVILGMLEKAPQVAKLWTDGGNAGPKLQRELAGHGLGAVLEIVRNPRTSRVSPSSAAAGRWSGPSPGCRGAGAWRRTMSGACRAPWPGRSSPPAGF